MANFKPKLSGLRPFNKMSLEERKAIQKAGGLASARQRRILKEENERLNDSIRKNKVLLTTYKDYIQQSLETGHSRFTDYQNLVLANDDPIQLGYDILVNAMYRSSDATTIMKIMQFFIKLKIQYAFLNDKKQTDQFVPDFLNSSNKTNSDTENNDNNETTKGTNDNSTVK